MKSTSAPGDPPVPYDSRRHFLQRAALLAAALPLTSRPLLAADALSPPTTAVGSSETTAQKKTAMSQTATNNTVFVVNPFEVPEGRRNFALLHWDRVDAFMKRQPGFLSAKLLEAHDPHAKFRFITVAEWRSVADFIAVLGSEELRELAQGLQEFPHYPGAYLVIRP